VTSVTSRSLTEAGKALRSAIEASTASEASKRSMAACRPFSLKLAPRFSQAARTASGSATSAMTPVTFSLSTGRRATALWRTGPPMRTISARSSSLNTGE
jgi:hypothetical protein